MCVTLKISAQALCYFFVVLFVRQNSVCNKHVSYKSEKEYEQGKYFVFAFTLKIIQSCNIERRVSSPWTGPLAA